MTKPTKEQLESMKHRHESLMVSIAGKDYLTKVVNGKVINIPVATKRKNERPR